MEKCTDICRDGAANIAGDRSGIDAKVEKVSHSNIMSTHCIAYREHPVA